MEWTKITPAKGSGGSRGAIEYPRVQRRQSHDMQASLILPGSYGITINDRVDIFHNGSGSLAILKATDGAYSVMRHGPQSKSVKISIPSAFKASIPVGTTRCNLSKIEGAYVLDLTQFAPPVRAVNALPFAAAHAAE